MKGRDFDTTYACTHTRVYTPRVHAYTDRASNCRRNIAGLKECSRRNLIDRVNDCCAISVCYVVNNARVQVSIWTEHLLRREECVSEVDRVKIVIDLYFDLLYEEDGD